MHIASLGAIVGSYAGFFPAIAAIVAVVWYSLEIYESQTVQSALARWKAAPASPSRIVAALKWAWANKFYAISAIASVTYTMQMLGYPIPQWLYFLYLVTGGAALHSSIRSSKK